jgi:ankyrin repeat protein
LSDRGANVHSQEEHCRTPLHLAALSGDRDMARWLIEHGANLHFWDDLGRTPFSVALETGHRKVARLLSDWVGSS